MTNKCKCYHNCDDISCKLFNCDGTIRTRQLSDIKKEYITSCLVHYLLIMEKRFKELHNDRTK